MRLESIFKYALFLVPLYFPTCMLQIITEIDVPELQLLASNLKPEECIQFISLDSQFPLSDEEVQKLAREQSCFRNLVKWICQLRTVTKNTWPVVNERLERIGRKDLVACLTEFKMKTSKSPKVIREVQLAEDSEGDEGVATAAVPPTTPKGTDANATTQNANQTINKFRAIGQKTFKVSLRTAGLVVASTILVTCCCTLFIRRSLANLWNKIFRRKKKKKGKLIDEGEVVSRSYFVRKPRAKKKRASSYELINTGTQGTMYIAPAEPEPPEPTGCYKCYKKKRKKSTRRPHR
ncbi:uncharacterized protein LOC143221185 isoform X3 [Lasioglossum baleicum]|uniref:uncharacterized protein LOC143221185 isoform X3 n=1 Tax=Lasioglossum baleicum TaxID=434251 RepID=UPI003FCD0FEC